MDKGDGGSEQQDPALLRDALDRAHELSDRLDRLQRIGGRLAGASTVEDVGRIVVDLLATPNTSATRGLWIVDEAGESLDLLTESGLAPNVASAFSSISTAADLPVADAFRTRRTVRSENGDDLPSRYPGMVGVERSTPGFLAVPLCIEEVALGVVVVGYDAEHLPDIDVQFAEAAAGHLAQSLARLWAARRERRRSEHVEFLGELTRTAVAATDHRDLMRRVTTAAVPRLGDWCIIYFTPGGSWPAETVIANVDPALATWAEQMRERFPLDPDASAGLAAVARTGVPEVLHRIDEALHDELAAKGGLDETNERTMAEGLQPSSAVTVPLRTKDGLLGAMQFIHSQAGHRYGDDDVALADAVAGRVADALHVRWMSDEQKRIATTLQRALLPPELPEVVGVDVAHRYWPAVTSAEVGGDFYDLFALDGATWAVVIGDVCGSGADAAAVTSTARHTIRAAARHGADAAEVLRWTNEAVRLSDRHLFCTVGYSTLTAVDGQWWLHATLAGHPQPVVRRADGSVETIGVGGTLLGVFESIQNTTVVTRLEVGDVVVFYTDGVTDLPSPFGIDGEAVERLVATAGAAASADATADLIVASVADRVPEASRRDDVALLVLRIVAPPFAILDT